MTEKLYNGFQKFSGCIYILQFGECYLLFSKLENLKRHVMTEHVTSGRSRCDFAGCNHVFRSEEIKQV